MSNARWERGSQLLSVVDGQGGTAVIQSLENIAPDLGRYIVEFAFGDIYARPVLTLQQRELITIVSLLTAGGCEPQLKVHIRGARNTGLSQEQIIEAFIHCVPYTGFPRVLNAVRTAEAVFQET